MKFVFVLLLSVATSFAGEENVTHRVTGLFSRDRENDLRAALEQVPGVRLTSVDFENAEAVFAYDPAIAFKDVKPEKIVERFNNALRAASHQTMGIAPLDPAPKDRLTRIEIPVTVLDCKAGALAAYECIAKIDGVVQAEARFKDGIVGALFDPERTDRAALEAALKARGVIGK